MFQVQLIQLVFNLMLNTPLREFCHSCVSKLKYNCVAKNLLVGNASHISYGVAKEKSLSKISYIIGSAGTTMEVVALGYDVQKVSPRLGSLKGKVVKLENVVWDGRYGVLKHGHGTVVQEAEEYEEDFADANFQFSQFHEIGTVKLWARISLQGCIHSVDIPQPSERKTGQSFCEFLLQNENGQAVRVKMVACHVPLPVLEARQEVCVLNCKVNSTTESLYVDLDDLCEVQIKGMAGSSYPLDLRGMVMWQGQ